LILGHIKSHFWYHPIHLVTGWLSFPASKDLYQVQET
jgi:hypothetical protein